MTARGLLLGLLLGLFVSVATYFNDWVIGQTQLIGNHLPVSIFGFAVVLLLGVNPILLRFGRGIAFRRSEVALMLTLGLAACGWPGSNFYRGFTTVTALPAHWIQTNPSWQANQVLSYVPGASAELGQGHVQDWLEIISAALPPDGARLVGDAPAPGARIWHGLSAEGQRAFRQIGAEQRVELDRIPELTRSLNEVLRSENFYNPAAFRGVPLSPRLQALLAQDDLAAHDIVLRNRLLLAAAFPQAILPPPEGTGALVDGGRADPRVVDTLLQRSQQRRRSASNLLRFGAYLGFAAYKNVLAAALGRMRSEDTPLYAVWAARALGVLMVLTCLALGSSGLGWTFSVVFVLLSLLTFVVLTRVVTETGAFFVQTGWSPVGVLAAVLGFEALGPTTFILLALASVLLVLDPREALMPFLANGLKLSERVGNVPIPKVVPWVSVMLLAGFAVAGSVTLYLQYNHSAIQAGNTWGTHQLPAIAFDALSRSVSESAAHGTLIQATGMSTSERFAAIRPAEGTLLWLTLGLVLVLTAAAARLRLPWWPLHPVAFLVWDTYPIIMFGASFLLGWLIKAAVVGTTGARGYHVMRPLMIGVIAGELVSALLWMGIGTSYFFATGQRPVTYSVFPL